MMRDEPVFLEWGCFGSILASCAEVYPNESLGVLAGRKTSRRHYLSLACPFQIAERGRSFVELDQKNIDLLIDSVGGAGLQFYGFYHSHPNAEASPSDEDLEYSIERLKNRDFEDYLEVVVSISRKKLRVLKYGLKADNTDHTIKGSCWAAKNRFKFHIKGEWVELSELGYEDHPNRYSAQLTLLEE